MFNILGVNNLKQGSKRGSIQFLGKSLDKIY